MRNIHQPVLVATKLVAKQVASATNKSAKTILPQQSVLACHLISGAKSSLSPPFRYSKLTYCLSLCLLAQACVVMSAFATDTSIANTQEQQAAVNTTSKQAIDNASSVAVKELQASKQAGSQKPETDEALEQALIALRLKRAVEQGIVDSSVLEAYQRETLNVAGTYQSDDAKDDQVQQAQSRQASVSANPIAIDNKMTNEPSITSILSDSSTLYDNTVANNAIADKGNSRSSSHSNQVIKDQRATGSHVFTNTSPSIVDVFSEIENMHTPEQIDYLLDEFGAQVSTDFDQPVARLDASEPPLGMSGEPALLHPNNLEVLGIKDIVSEQESIGTGSQQAVPVYQATDVVAEPNKAQRQDHNTNASLAVAQNTESSQAEINPDDYLPDYQKPEFQQRLGAQKDKSGVEQKALIAQEVEHDTDDVKPGLVKRLYNRFFNDGVSGLPRVKATVYLNKMETPLTAEEFIVAINSSDPRLVVADKNTQPITNIKAAMENIPVGSISDFTAAVPKLYQEALDAAQAVGYYDIKLSFRKVASDKIAVMIDHLGDPVKVSSRIIDIRGEGEQLKEFQTIVDNSPPKVGDVFNHGVYEKTKQEIEITKEQFGFFDGEWLNRSVDVILPDNTADIDLIYNTGERYRFDEVVFFTIDKETGQLTTDPDKLPVRAELLHQLHEFKVGDKFAAPLVTKFTNDLSMTRYFNSVNVEAIRPGVSRGVLAFEEVEEKGDEQGISTEAGSDIVSENDTDLDDHLAAEASVVSATNLDAKNNSSVADNGEESFKSLTDQDNVESDSFDEEFAPLVYAVDAETSAKVAQIREKAERLSRLPDDRVLDEVEAEAKSLLGKIANTISNTVKKILPDEKDPLAESASLPDDLSQTVLANRKTPQQVAESKSVPLYVFVSADKPRDMDIGIGYGTDTGMRAVTRLENNLINKEGYQAGITVGASKINRNVSLHGSRPWKHPLDDILTGNISFEQEEINQGKGNLDLETNTIQAGVARNIRKENGWNQTFSLRYRFDKLESGVEGPAREDLPVPFNRDGAKFEQEALLLGYQLDRTKADNSLNPTKGWRQYYSIEAGTKDVLTDTNMAIARAGVSGLYSFGEHNKHQILASLDGGYIWANDFEEVPYKLRFFAGGDRSIRGYDYNSLSALEKGFLVGGQVLAVGSAEYNYEFKPGLRGAVFADVGNAYDKDFEAETKLGIGFGVRWASPVGMVRVDLGAGVLEDSIPIRLHFFIGSPLQ